MSTHRSPTIDFDVPEDEAPSVHCPYCDRPFRSERYATFHVGLDHPDECTDEEREAYETERDDEEYDLFTFHVKAIVVVLLTYFLFTYFYAMAWTS